MDDTDHVFPQLVQIASAVGLVLCFPPRNFCRSIRVQ